MSQDDARTFHSSEEAGGGSGSPGADPSPQSDAADGEQRIPSGSATVDSGTAAPPSPPAPLAIASLGDRLVAQLVDGLLAFGLAFFLASALIPRLEGLVSPAWDARLVGLLVALGITALVLLLYFIAGEKQLGFTLGKVAAGVRVRRADGGRLTGRAALIRNTVRVPEALTLYLVSAVAVLATKRGQRIGDLLAGTVVIRSEPPRPIRVAALVLAMLVAAGGVLGGLSINSTGPATGNQLGTPPGPVPSPSPAERPRITAAIVTDSRASDAGRSTFPPHTPEVFVRFTLSNVAPGSELRAVWIAEEAAGIPSGYTMDSVVSQTAGGAQIQGVFSHPRPPNGWPLGRYRVDLYLNGQFERALRFTIEAPDRAPTTSPIVPAPGRQGSPTIPPGTV